MKKLFVQFIPLACAACLFTGCAAVNRQSEIEEKLDLTKNQAPSQIDTGSADETEEKNSEVQNTAKTVRSQTKASVKV